ncbi:Serine/threonine protein phosphatase PrpC [Cnuella takakiae]|uniref:Serine/threonine protein phosphatase PrpC n=1 Tax=Cnuella takakiae TaxID=1302690 RepID=A0A1M4UWA5_9BACT|nr:protein phosphatase 2C domain-containing protein [Cnuella takakiae]OLY92766.1 hypothetical protein BUE76_13365 [Cnuella takakiae]SHE60939.1 Serine/threonine protein phosphatase PrpC [Cnuella takakiae]
MTNLYFGATHKGMVRSNNEDSFFVQPVMQGAYLAACVIDGVGGYEGGEVAAQLAHDTLLEYLSVPSGSAATMMLEAMTAANDRILAERRANPKLADMACVATLVLADEQSNTLHYIHVGDTRLYLYRDGSLVKVTRDQSFVGFLEDSGKLSEGEAMHHLKRNEIDKALGFDLQLRNQKDYFDTGTSPYLPGDILLLCSDGLTDLVTAADIRAVLASEDALPQKTERLIDAANRAGGKDNITVVLVRHSRKPQNQKAIKPKGKPGRKKKVSPVSPVVPQPAEQAAKDPVAMQQPVKKKKAWIPYLVLLPLILATVLFIWQQQQKPASIAVIPPDPLFQKLEANLAAAPDTLNWMDNTRQMITVQDTLLVQSDSLLIKGNGLHLVADSSFSGAAFSLGPKNKHLVLEDMVFENFETAILAGGHSVQLKNVQFLNCAVPVQMSGTAPVNSPANLMVSDSLFSDTTQIR